jgi:hypothetical protein
LVFALIVGELEPLRLAHLAQQRPENSVSGPISRWSSLLQHELLGGERRLGGARRQGQRLGLGERRQIVGAAAHGIEQRVVRFVELSLRVRQLPRPTRSETVARPPVA